MKKLASVLSLVTGVALFAGCGGGSDNDSTPPSNSNTTTANPSTSVSSKVAQDVLTASMSSMQTANINNKATINIQAGENSAHAVVTFNDPMIVQGGSATLTGTMTMDMVISGQSATADVQVDLAATYSQATLVCDDGTHVVNGSFNINGPMEVDSHVAGTTATVTGSWTWALASDDLTIDGVAYDVDLVYSGTITFPGTLQATLTGTINGVAVSQNISVAATY